MPSLNSDNSVNVIIGTEADDSGINKVTDSMSGMVDNFQSGMRKISLATAAVGVGLTAFAKSSTDYLTDLVKSSKSLAMQTGMTIEQSSSMIAVLQRLGISADAASTTFKIFAKQIANAQNSTDSNSIANEQLKNKIDATKIAITQLTDQIDKHGDATGALHNKLQGLNLDLKNYQQQLDSATGPLDKLNVATKNADGSNRSFNDILLNVADRFKDLPDGAQKTALALELFGRSGTQMIKVLDKGSQGIQDLEEKAQKLGLTLTAQNIGAINDYIQSQKDLADTTNSMRIAVGSLTAPVLTKFNEKLNGVMQSLMGVDSPLRAVTADVLAFGGPVLTATSAVAGFLGNLGSASGILGGIVEFLANPIFLAFAAALAVIGFAVYELQKSLGGWSNLMKLITQDAMKIWNVLSQQLGPSLKALWGAIRDDLVPALKDLWKELGPQLMPVIKFLAEVGFVQFIATLWAIINVLRILIEVMSFFARLWIPIIEGFQKAFSFIDEKVEYMKNHFAESVGAIIGFFVTLPVKIPLLIAAAIYKSIDFLLSIDWGRILSNVGHAFENLGEWIWQAIKHAWDRVTNLNWGQLLVRVGKDIANDIIDAIQGAINGAFSGIPGHPHVNLPHFEKGVRNFGGGLAVVGDVAGRGGELVSLPKGSDVYSNQESKKMLGATGGLNITQHIYNQVDYTRGLAEIGFRLSQA